MKSHCLKGGKWNDKVITDSYAALLHSGFEASIQSESGKQKVVASYFYEYDEDESNQIKIEIYNNDEFVPTIQMKIQYVKCSV